MFKLARLKNKHFLVLAGNGFVSAVGFATSFILFHFLSAENAGIWFVVQSFVALCEAARYGFLATATVKFYAGTDPERGRTVLGSVWFLALALTGCILLIDAVAWQFLPHITNYQARLCIIWVGITYLSSLPADVIFWKLQAEEKYNTMLWYRMLNTCSSIVAFIILILVHKMTLENALMANLVTNVLSSLVGVLLKMSGFMCLFSKSKECTKELFHYGKFTLGTTSISVLLGNADTWIINFLLGPAAVAVYNLAMRLMAFIDLPLRSFVTTGMSEMAIQFNQKNIGHLTYIFKKYAGMLTIAFIPAAMGAYLIADLITSFLGGHGYLDTQANELYQLFMCIAILYPLDRFNGLALDILHHEKTNFMKVVIMLIAKVAGDFGCIYLFERAFGADYAIYGVAAAMLLSTLAGLLFGYYKLNKIIPHTLGGVVGMGFSETLVFVRSFKRK
jgi:O-antigen/teichoic acid export membrane protein